MAIIYGTDDTLYAAAGTPDLYGDEHDISSGDYAGGEDSLYGDSQSNGLYGDAFNMYNITNYISLIGGDDFLDGADSFVYDGVAPDAGGVLTITEGHDRIIDFDASEGDVIDLDGIFDALGVAAAEDRAGMVNFDEQGSRTILTVEGQADFSVTLAHSSLGTTEGGLTDAELQGLGITVGDAS
ncbi:type I secretion C-terminal target domain-containing protein [Sneathiella chungangensis]|uniref:Type I secretion C-terminal target domain-containing protein n=1 Tax=Sneathiella chungangensis TaxID=1418234 RepID=A0A845MEK7_9PROT|nr:type I secretion C-terminal target domain-containing protein [Sneathiella chungangensis]MZR22299.1 type I secretion C-terminal target domain-containing protein [Sneathiella chungangensis]